MKLEKLLCLKYRGRRVVENLLQSQTMKLLRALLHETTESVDGSSTISKVLVRNGGGPMSFNPSIGCGEKLEDEEDDDPAAHVTVSSSLILTPFIDSLPAPPASLSNFRGSTVGKDIFFKKRESFSSF